jgi:hypothetical protein
MNPTGPQLPLDLWPAFESNLRERVLAIVNAGESSKVPPCGATAKDRSYNVLLFLETLSNYYGVKIPPVPHEVHWTSELKSSSDYLRCQARIDKIAELLQTGDSEINDPAKRYLSRRVEYAFDPQKKSVGACIDRQLRETGIRHFHMGEPKRTDDLLMGIIRERNVYLIGVYTHEDLQTNAPLHRAQTHWPFLFETLSGISGSDLEPEQVKTIRKRSANFAIGGIDGAAIMPRDMFTSAGFSVLTTRDRDFFHLRFTELDKDLTQMGSNLRVELAAQLDVAEPEMRLVLEQPNHPDNFDTKIILREQSTTRLASVVFRPEPPNRTY